MASFQIMQPQDFHVAIQNDEGEITMEGPLKDVYVLLHIFS